MCSCLDYDGHVQLSMCWCLDLEEDYAEGWLFSYYPVVSLLVRSAPRLTVQIRKSWENFRLSMEKKVATKLGTRMTSQRPFIEA